MPRDTSIKDLIILAARHSIHVVISDAPLMGERIELTPLAKEEPTDEAAQLRRRTQVSAKGWISGWGEVSQLGHATFYGEARTEMIGGVPVVYVCVPEIEETAERMAAPEEEHFFPLSTLYRFSPTSKAKVLSASAWRGALKPEDTSAHALTDAIVRGLTNCGRFGMIRSDVAALTPEQITEIEAWITVGCPGEGMPESYRKAAGDLPF